MTLFVRIGARNRWENNGVARRSDDESDVTQATKDLSLRDDEEALSGFLVETAEEAREVASLFAQTQRERPDNVDYIQLPLELITRKSGLNVTSASNTPWGQAMHPKLRERYVWLHGLDADRSRELARATLAGNHKVSRISRKHVELDCATRAAADSELSGRLSPYWKTTLQRKR